MKRKMSIITNVLIVLFEIFALIKLYINNEGLLVEYYTVDSNLLALLSSILLLVYLFRNKKVPSYLRILKYVSVVCLTITFFVVVFVLLPMLDFNYHFILLDGSMFYHHVLCPVLAFITFIWFDDLGKFKKKDYYYPIIFTLCYAFILIILNYLLIVDGPYPFLRIYKLTILSSILWFAGILFFGYLASKSILKLKINKKPF